MATFTITTGTSEATAVRVDSLAGKSGDDTYNVNGGWLLQDRDTRYGLNPSNSHGTISGSPSLGGTILFRGDKARLIYFTGGSGTVPAYDTTISQGGASGLLMSVHTALNAAPTAPGAAMPTSGYIRLRQHNGGAFASGALTGITATCAADPVFGTYDRAGYIIVVGRDAKNTNVSRLNNPTEDVFKGDWFLMGVTDGNRATTYQIPSNGDAMYIGGVQVETSAGSGVFEWWPVTTSAMTAYNIRTTGEASKQCHITPGSAVIRFGSDGTNSSGGACPPSGCKVRVPNIFLQGCTAAAPTVNSFSGISSRHYFYANGAGRWRVNNVSSSWRQNLVTNAYEVVCKDSSFCHTLTITGNATPYEIENVCVSTPVDDGLTNNALALSSSFVGGTLTDCVFSVGKIDGVTRYSLSGTSSSNAEFNNCKFLSSGMPTTGAAAVNTSICDNLNFQNCYFVGRHSHSQTTRVTTQGCTHGGITAGAPLESSSDTVWMSLSNKSSGHLAEDWAFPEPECLAKAQLINVSASSSNNKFRNLGSFASPISAKSATAVDVPWTRSGATVTVTLTGHGWRTNDYIKILYSTSPTATPAGFEQITVTGANTFTFNGVNAGDTSGTITLFRVWTNYAVDVASGCENNEFQNIHIDGAYSGSANIRAGSNNTTLLNVNSGIGSAYSVAGNDLVSRGVWGSAGLPGASAAQYGHTFIDGIVQTSPTATGAVGASWTRSAGTITVTSPDHGIEVNNTRVRISDPSDPTPVVASTPWKYVTPLTKDTFSFAGTASGSTSGTISWDAPTDKLVLYMNEQSDTVSRYTIDAGTPAFTGAGALAATTVGDQITWEMPEFLINYTGFPNVPIETTLNETEASQGVYRFTYDIAKDGGAFTGTFKNLSLIRAATGGTSGTAIMTFASTTDIAAGDRVTGLGVPRNTTVQSVDSATQITLSANLTTTASGSYQFNHLPAETFTSSFKLKVRQTTVTANSLSNTYLVIALSSDAASRALAYPIAVDLQTQEVNLVNGVPGTRVQVYDLTSNTELANEVVATFPFNWTDPNPYVADREIRVRAAYVDGVSAKEFVDVVVGTATNADPVVTYRLNQVDDEVYNTNAVDGSTVTFLTIDDVNARHEIDEPSGTITLQDWYAASMYYRFTATGIAGGTLALTATDTVNYALAGKEVKNVSSPSVPLKITGGWINDADTGDPLDLVDSTGGTIFLAPPHVVGYATGSGVTPTDVADIAGAVWDEALSSHTTAGTAGKGLADAEANTDIIQGQL